jgi:hypothetical protein
MKTNKMYHCDGTKTLEQIEKEIAKDKRPAMIARIQKHGEDLKTLFNLPADTDPVKLCKALRRLEAKGEAIGLQLCNGPEMSEEEQEKRSGVVLIAVYKKLKNTDKRVPVILNLDPRGYALKIKEEWTREYRNAGKSIYTDMGGYGIIAPDLTNG